MPLAAFHLRPTREVPSRGPELPAGTALDVLDPAAASNHPLRRGQQVLLHVRVRAGSPPAEGYTFVAPTELQGDCPVVWPQLMEASLDLSGGSASGNSSAEAVALATRREFSDYENFDRAPHQRIDLDGDGTDEEIVSIERDNDTFSRTLYGVFRRGTTFVAWQLGSGGGGNYASHGTTAPVRIGNVTYIPSGFGTSPPESSPEEGRQSAYALGRCRPGGPCPMVFGAWTLFGDDETWSFSDAGNGDLRVTSSLGRTQVLHWNAATWRFTP